MMNTILETIDRLQERAESSYICIINDDRAIGNRLEAYEEASVSDNVSTLTFRVKINDSNLIEISYGDKKEILYIPYVKEYIQKYNPTSISSVIDAIHMGVKDDYENSECRDEIIREFLESIPSLEDELSGGFE